MTRQPNAAFSALHYRAEAVAMVGYRWSQCSEPPSAIVENFRLLVSQHVATRTTAGAKVTLVCTENKQRKCIFVWGQTPRNLKAGGHLPSGRVTPPPGRRLPLRKLNTCPHSLTSDYSPPVEKLSIMSE